MRCLVLSLALGAALGQMFGGGGRGKLSEEEEHMQGAPMGEAAVDRAMREWDTLANQPEMMQEMMESFKDPEVQAKAKEMINDPEYMRAAKKKLAAMQRKAQEQGLLDGNGNPIAGAATHAASSNPAAAAMMATLLSGRGGAAPAAGAAGAGAGAGAGNDMAAQIAALQRQNAALKSAMGAGP